MSNIGTAASGKVLQGTGNGNNPTFSTATFPSTAGSAGTILRSDGTNIVNSTATYPGTAGTSGTLLTSNGTNIVNTTSTYPSTAGTSGTILRSNGTNIVNTTATYPTTTTINRILFSSAANVIGEITTANNSIVSTNASGVPSLGTSLTNDYTFTNATAGATRTLTIAHTDNTNTASNSVVSTTVGGTSSGDPFYRSAVGSTRSYAFGTDTSDSQNLKINTTNSGTVTPSSGTNIMTMTSGGNRTLPLNSCCNGDLSTTTTDATGDGTLVNPVVFNSELFDQNGNFNTTTGVFTAPVTGKYLISGSVTFGDLTSSHTSGEIRIVADGVTYKQVFNPGAIRDASNQFTASITRVCAMTATSTASILVSVSGSTKTVDLLQNNFGQLSGMSVCLVS